MVLLLQLELTAPVFSVFVGVLPLAQSNALREVAVRKKERILWHLSQFLLTADSIAPVMPRMLTCKHKLRLRLKLLICRQLPLF